MHSPLPPDPVGPPAVADQAVPASATLSGPDAATGGDVAVPVPAAVETSHPIDRARGAPAETAPVEASSAAAEDSAGELAPADLPPHGAPMVTSQVHEAAPPPDAPR
jgi:hypothetical protein